jgi:hypothetical protein
MKETVQTDLAAEVERLREQVLDLGEAVVTLTALAAEQGMQIGALFTVMRAAIKALGVPSAGAALDAAAPGQNLRAVE